jgi:hypothetical protein
MGKIEWIAVPADDRVQLEALVANRNTAQKVVWRARIVLLCGGAPGVGCGCGGNGQERSDGQTLAAAGISYTAVQRI